MGKRNTGITVGVGMIVVGIAMHVVFGYFVEVETPIIGLPQVGAVIAVLGLVELIMTIRGGSRESRGISSGS